MANRSNSGTSCCCATTRILSRYGGAEIIVSVRGLYCRLIKTTSAPAFCSAATPSSTALRKSSGSMDRIASTVPVCQMTKVGFFASTSLTRPGATSSAVLPVCSSTDRLTGDRRQLLLQRGLQPRRDRRCASDAAMVDERLPTTRIFSGWPFLTASATFGSVLSRGQQIGRDLAGLAAASSARAEAGGRKAGEQRQAQHGSRIRTSWAPSRHDRHCRRCLCLATHLCRRMLVPRNHPRHAAHDEDSGRC